MSNINRTNKYHADALEDLRANIAYTGDKQGEIAEFFENAIIDANGDREELAWAYKVARRIGNKKAQSTLAYLLTGEE